jgi:hypothetical protein
MRRREKSAADAALEEMTRREKAAVAALGSERTKAADTDDSTCASNSCPCNRSCISTRHFLRQCFAIRDAILAIL